LICEAAGFDPSSDPRNFHGVRHDELDFETRSSDLAVFDGGDHRDRPAFNTHFGRI
jgi:hypothetical protein